MLRNILVPRNMLIPTGYGVLVLLLLLSNGSSQAGSSPVEQRIEQQGIPIYPGAVLWSDSPNTNSLVAGDFSLRTNAPIEDVVTFYNKILLARGWGIKLDGENEVDNHRLLSADRSDPTGTELFQRTILVDFYTVPSSSGVTLLNVHYGRQPDPNKLPTYTGARNVETSWEKDPDYQNWYRVTNYDSSASQSDIRTFYTQTMQEQGWSLGQSSGLGLVFGWQDPVSGPEYGVGFRVEISTQPSAHGGTRVEVRLTGTNIAP